MLTRGVSELTDEFRGVLLLEVIVDILSVFITLTLLNVGWVIAKSVAEKQVPWIARVAEATNFQQIVLNRSRNLGRRHATLLGDQLVKQQVLHGGNANAFYI